MAENSGFSTLNKPIAYLRRGIQGGQHGTSFLDEGEGGGPFGARPSYNPK